MSEDNDLDALAEINCRVNGLLLDSLIEMAKQSPTAEHPFGAMTVAAAYKALREALRRNLRTSRSRLMRSVRARRVAIVRLRRDMTDDARFYAFCAEVFGRDRSWVDLELELARRFGLDRESTL